MANIFQELQMIALSNGNSVIEARKQLNEIVALFKSREPYLQELTVFAEKVRNLKAQTLLDADGFMVQPDVTYLELPEELRHDSLGFCRNDYMVFSGRFVYPVKDVRGDVMGFCGYDKFSDVKYLDSINNGYKAKETTVYGMERLEEYYYSKDPVFFVEGIVCCLYLRQNKYQALATLGSHLTPYVIQIASRFGHRAVFITDSDEAGNKYRKQVNRVLPKARCVQSCIAKDVDDSRLVNPNIVNEFEKFKNPFYKGEFFR